ncbi:hypothetical protein HN51_063129 [Arachis hypogaea]
MVVRLICSDYNSTPSNSFESSSAGAYKIADEAKFFSFGTNDLTQMTFGYSGDDVEKFLSIYLSSDILQSDPFEVLQQLTPSVGLSGWNMRRAWCQPSSIAFFAQIGLALSHTLLLDSYRVPIEKLAAAQVAV